MPRPFAPLALPPPPLLLPAALPLLLPPAGSSASSVTDARAPAEKRRERGKVGQDRKEDKNGKKRREAENGKKVRGGKNLVRPHPHRRHQKGEQSQKLSSLHPFPCGLTHPGFSDTFLVKFFLTGKDTLVLDEISAEFERALRRFRECYRLPVVQSCSWCSQFPFQGHRRTGKIQGGMSCTLWPVCNCIPQKGCLFVALLLIGHRNSIHSFHQFQSFLPCMYSLYRPGIDDQTVQFLEKFQMLVFQLLLVSWLLQSCLGGRGVGQNTSRQILQQISKNQCPPSLSKRIKPLKHFPATLFWL